MPRRVFNWTFDDVVDFLKEHNFSLTHVEGSHHFYFGHHGGAPRQVHVQFHGRKALKPRTLKSIILQSGIPKDEWLK